MYILHRRQDGQRKSNTESGHTQADSAPSAFYIERVRGEPSALAQAII